MSDEQPKRRWLGHSGSIYWLVTAGAIAFMLAASTLVLVVGEALEPGGGPWGSFAITCFIAIIFTPIAFVLFVMRKEPHLSTGAPLRIQIARGVVMVCVVWGLFELKMGWDGYQSYCSRHTLGRCGALEGGIRLYRSRTGRLPPDAGGGERSGEALLEALTGFGPSGEALDRLAAGSGVDRAKIGVDGWGTPIRYDRDGWDGRPVLISAGPDKRFGTDDDQRHAVSAPPDEPPPPGD